MYFRFELREQKPLEYRTLADVPEWVRCICHTNSSALVLRMRLGDLSKSVTQSGDAGMDYGFAEDFWYVQILDPLPTPLLPKTLAECEEGRCVKLVGSTHLYFRHGGHTHMWNQVHGHVNRSGVEAYDNPRFESLTDIYAVPCEIEVAK